jgi:hypothetical protein
MPETYNGLTLPRHMERLPRDSANRPVPAFVEWIDGAPDFRVMSHKHLVASVKLGLCWTCGEQLGSHKTFVIGPVCAVNRISAEPPSHTDCARFSAIACPFLSNPNKVRRDANMPEGGTAPAGVSIPRNPGVTLLWTVRRYKMIRDGNGVLFQIGEPDDLEWYCRGRAATSGGTPRPRRPKVADTDVPQRQEGEATPAFLARVLAAEGAPGHMVSLAAEAHYDDFLSPLATPCLQLLADAREAGLDNIVAWHTDGVFDATKVESDAWAKSPEGQSVFAELASGKNRAQRRADEKRRRRDR